MGVIRLADNQKFKKNKGNRYAHDAEFAEEVLAKHERRHDPYPVQNELNVKGR